nr:DEAD/DEAH box helicase [Ligilactobacillus hayakitensis]
MKMEMTLQNAVLNSLVNQTYEANQALSPKLITNQRKDNVWNNLRNELRECTNFFWAVAFITVDMLTPIKVVLADLEKKNIKGTLITGTYLGFNSPQVYRELMKIPNLEVYLTQEDGFHAKGFWFDHEDYQTLFVGSANLTRNALLKNQELLLRVSSLNAGALVNETKLIFDELIAKSEPLNQEWIEAYAKTWQAPKAKSNYKQTEIKPNQMQKAALKELDYLVKNNAKKALIVSATGTGKTYLGAFAVKNYAPQRFLFVVHRQQIAKAALESFYRVLGGNRSDYQLLSGTQKNFEAKYTFATIQTLSQDDVLQKYQADAFDYIIIDEAHRSAAKSYQKVMGYLTPKFYLGLTATPERTDEQDVYQIFDYNLAYEIRLKEALENQMLSPFHYIGVQDYEEDGIVIDETTNLRYLTSKTRVEYILKQLDYYGYSGSHASGLVFCSRQDEAKKLAQEFNQQGYLAQALTNEDSQSYRQKTVAAFEKGELNYIITVDLFNEGIDIPCVNQVILLRNTQSSIIFTQQLGRGLRKFKGKEFLTVIDFIGNYQNNYLIPIALSGDNSRDKDQVKNQLLLAKEIDVSTINFTEIATKKILTSLEQTKLDSMLELKRSYKELSQKIGRPPLLLDFLKYNSTNSEVFIKNNNLKHYGDFLQKMGVEIKLSDYEQAILHFLTKELANGMRIHELLLLEMLCQKEIVSKEEWMKQLEIHNAVVNDAVIQSSQGILDLSFFDVKAGKTTKAIQYGQVALVEDNLLEYRLNSRIKAALKENEDFAKLFKDVLQVGKRLNRNYDNQTQFTLYQRYSRKDVCRLLNWPKDVSAPMYGYRVDKDECPIFITYQKDDDKKRNALYQNDLHNGTSLRWYTRSPRSLESDEVKRLLAGVDEGKQKMKIHVFVKRSDAYGKEFYYLGQAKIDGTSVAEEILANKKTVGMDLKLTTPLSAEMRQVLFLD